MKICPKCASENTDTAKYCNECGMAFEIEKTESVETTPIPDTQFAPADLKEDVNPSPEAMTDNQNLVDDHNENIHENTGVQHSNSEISQPEKKKTIKLKIWQKVLIAIVAVLAILIFRPRITNVSIGYKGDTTAGTVLDDNNPGFYATGTTNYGKQVEIPYTDLRIKEPKTLEADSSETVTVYYKNASVDLTIDCSTTSVKSISADYNGSEYEGTKIDKNSDIKVVATYGSGQTQEVTFFSVDPEITTLKNGVTSEIKVTVTTDAGRTYTDILSITGKAKPFTEPEIEGDHYNCSINQFVKYLNDNTTITLFPMDVNAFGEGYKSYGIIPPKEVNLKDGEALVLGLRENNDGKLSHIMVWSSAPAEGIWTSLQLARLFDDSINTTDTTSVESFLKSHVYEGDDMIVYYEESNDHYDIYLMTRDFYNNNVKQ